MYNYCLKTFCDTNLNHFCIQNQKIIVFFILLVFKERAIKVVFLAILIGAISTGLAFLASVSVDTIVSLVMKIRGTFGGPMVGVFTLGLFVPWSNTLVSAKFSWCGFIFIFLYIKMRINLNYYTIC